MQIIYIHTTNIDSQSTSANFVINNSYSLARHHENVILFLMNSSTTPAEKVVREKFSMSKPPSLKIIEYYAEESRHFSFYRFVVNRLKTLANSNTVVITRALGILPHLFLAGRKAYNKLFFETHDFYYDLSIRDDIKKTKNYKNHLIEKLFFKKIDGLICLSKHQKNLYKQYLPRQDIAVFPTGLNPKRQLYSEKSSHFIYSGSLNESKGLENILSLCRHLNNGHKIWIIGARTEQEKKRIHSMFENNHLSDKIEILPWMKKSELGKYFSKAKMGLLPVKHTFFNRHLTVPLKLFDYYSYKLPVIATDSELLREWVTDQETGILVNWDNPEDSINEIEEILANENRYNEMVSNVMKKMKQHTWAERSKNQIKYFKTRL